MSCAQGLVVDLVLSLAYLLAKRNLLQNLFKVSTYRKSCIVVAAALVALVGEISKKLLVLVIEFYF